MKNIKTIAFDADDTLWICETIFSNTQQSLTQLLEHYVDPKILKEVLYETEIKNLKHFGYGIKGFTLSMIESAIELSQGKITGTEIQKIVELGKEMIDHPVEVLPNIVATLEKIKDNYQLMIITKGDLFDQENKIARSGLSEYFDLVEIVSEKDATTYQSIIEKHNINIEEFLMVGNSLKSDVFPVSELGGKAIHIPFHTTWGHEIVRHNGVCPLYYELADVSLLTEWLAA